MICVMSTREACFAIDFQRAYRLPWLIYGFQIVQNGRVGCSDELRVSMVGDGYRSCSEGSAQEIEILDGIVYV